jgi:hypothetical protein
VTVEQLATAFNGLCRRWLEQRHGREHHEQLSFLLMYQQRRNAAAKKSHQRQCQSAGSS